MSVSETVIQWIKERSMAFSQDNFLFFVCVRFSFLYKTLYSKGNYAQVLIMFRNEMKKKTKQFLERSNLMCIMLETNSKKKEVI